MLLAISCIALNGAIFFLLHKNRMRVATVLHVIVSALLLALLFAACNIDSILESLDGAVSRPAYDALSWFLTDDVEGLARSLMILESLVMVLSATVAAVFTVQIISDAARKLKRRLFFARGSRRTGRSFTPCGNCRHKIYKLNCSFIC